MRRAYKYLLPVALISAIGFAVYLGKQANDQNQRSKPKLIGGLECGHWAVYRVCELMGIPVSPKFLQEQMPSGDRGHSLKEIADTLRKAGLIVRGRQESFDTFLTSKGIRVVHIVSPEHFIVVVRCDADRVLFLDHRGRRQSLPVDKIRPHWSGNLLYVERPSNSDVIGFDREQATKDRPRIQFANLFIDKGDLSTTADSTSVTFEYPFQNTGGVALQVKKVHTTCTCLKSKKPDRAIQPGETGSISLEYSLKNSPSTFQHEAVVETNDPKHPKIILRAAGNANVLVTVSPTSLDLGNVPYGSERIVPLFVTYTGGEDFEIQGMESPIGGFQLHAHRNPKGEFAEELWPGSRSSLDLGTRVRVVEVRYAANRLGPVMGTISIQTNIPRFEKITVAVSGNVVPPVSLVPPLLSLGESAPDVGVERTVLVTATGKKPIKIVNVSSKIETLNWSIISNNEDPTRIQIRFAGKAEIFQRLSGSKVRVTLASGDRQFDVDLPVFATKKRTP